MDRLRRETGDTDIRRLFNVASALHVNFYEDLHSGESVAEALDDVERFVNKLDALVLARIHRSETSVSLTQGMMGKGRRTGLARFQ